MGVFCNTPNYDEMEDNPICRKIPWQANDEHLVAWKEGTTGFPWIDAAMRQLHHDGWIHHLARYAVACFLDLWISWEELNSIKLERGKASTGRHGKARREHR